MTNKENKVTKEKGNSPKKTETQKNSSKPQDIIAAMLGGNTVEGEEKKPKKRPYLHFKEFGLIIPYWAIVSVEKKEEMVKRGGKYGWVFEIVLNMGIESSPNMPFGEHKLIYDTAELRDAKFEALVSSMQEDNYEFNEI